VHPVTKRKRFAALSSGDFTPLCDAEVQFYSLHLKDGTELQIQSAGAARDTAVVRMSSSAEQRGLWKQLKGSVKDAVANEKRTFEETVHRQNKLQWAKNSLLARLPYHPQVYEAGTQFVAELQKPVEVRSASKPTTDLAQLGAKPPPDSILHARLNSVLSSSSNKWGDRVDATLTQPLLTGDGKLILPEGTHLIGSVTQAVPSKRFGRNGQLAFDFRQIQLSSGITQPVRGNLAAADADAKTKIDEEGHTRATQPTAKALLPLATVLLAQSIGKGDNDGINGSQSGSLNHGIAGGGLGLAGRILAFSAGSRSLAYGIGYYGAGRSIYSRFIARGHDVVFPRDTQIEIKVGVR
jgi:hypothetical protein